MMEEEVKKKVVKKSVIAYRDWHLSMVKNYSRLSAGSVERGYPNSVQYFEQKAFEHQEAAARIRT